MDNPVTSSETPNNRPDANSINIAVPVILGAIVLILIVALLLSALLFCRKRGKLCFKVRYDDVKPFLRTDKQLDSEAQKRGFFYQKLKQKPLKKRQKKKKNSKVKYHSIGKAPRFPRSDPFAKKFLENPMIDDDDFDVDWSNPAFDMAQAQARDAAIMVQSWYRMVRYGPMAI